MSVDGESDGHQIGLVAAIALCVGTMVGGGVFALSGIILNDTGPLAMVAYFLAAVAVLFSALSFAAVASRAKDGDSGYGPIAQHLGPRWRFVTMWAFYVSAIAGGAFMLVAFGSYLRYFLAAANPLLMGLAAALALVLLNLGPIDLVGRTETALVVFKLTVLVGLIGVGLASFKVDLLVPFAPHGLGVVLTSSGLLFSAYLGFSVVTNVAGVVKNPRRTVPLAILVSLLIVAIVYVGITVAMLMSGQKAFGAAGVAQAANSLIGPWGGAIIAITACVSTLSGANAVILGNSQLLIKMAANGDIPARMGHIRKGGHAYASVLLTGIVAVVLMLTGGLQSIVAYCSVAGIVGLVLMNVTALQMARNGWPGAGLRLPFGIAIPALGTILALAQLPSLGWKNVLIGLSLVAAGLVVYAVRERSLRTRRRSNVLGPVNLFPPQRPSVPPTQSRSAGSA
ncbi:amino acid permease [Nakamurella antarctica]|uniref:Amino acid permease n=1 Tax=Nakamurella antarctica TaxID=1902245 RepID=A0A3G8ZIH9_9ACTN|nr:APC family permease [Nakamurella antarctica]AZI57202.1 amino acid permease [Nakamurella antarctica]